MTNLKIEGYIKLDTFSLTRSHIYVDSEHGGGTHGEGTYAALGQVVFGDLPRYGNAPAYLGRRDGWNIHFNTMRPDLVRALLELQTRYAFRELPPEPMPYDKEYQRRRPKFKVTLELIDDDSPDADEQSLGPEIHPDPNSPFWKQ